MICMSDVDEKKEEKEKDWFAIENELSNPALEELKNILEKIEKQPLVIIGFPAFGIMAEHVIQIIKDHEGVVESVIKEVEEGKITTAEIICETQDRLEEKIQKNIVTIIIQKGCSVTVAFL